MSKPTKVTLFTILFVLVGLSILITLELGGVTDFYSRTSSTVSPVRQISGNPSANPTNTVDYGPPSEEDNVPISSKNPDSSSQEEVVNDLGVSITRTSKNEDNQTYLVRAIVVGTSEGTCTASFTSGDNVATISGSIGIVGGQSSCMGLDIPLSQLSQSQKWNLTLSVQTPDGKTASTNMEVIL